MNQHRQGNLSNFQEHKEKTAPDHGRAGDYRAVNGKIEKSEDVIQDRQSHVEIHPFFGELSTDFIIPDLAENTYIGQYETGGILISDASGLLDVLQGVRRAMKT